MIRIIVTGSNGQLGQTLQELAPAYDSLFFHFRTSVELDITEPVKVLDCLKQGNYDYCINLAAFTNVEQAEKYPEKAFKVNAKGTKNLATACKKHQIKLIHISTDYVFDGKKEGPYTIADTPNPINEYGKSKLKGEQCIRDILNDHYIVRTSWLYSKKYGHNFYRSILKQALEGKELRVTDDQKGCPTNTEALSKFLLEEILIEQIPFGTYHFTGGRPTTWFGFAQCILEENGLTDKVDLVLDRNYRTFAKRPKNSVLL
ncbi:dTDP-4-dehydrorhamnose reductase [Allomuricauda sp. M10]|uniref:dTDP-4-dehydrorhamnose reductase n=1 Tax=Allomuricauda sp. M10 TaxID=2683292 RepID=UPI001D191655|nr:dTDP-4-dehydrorhamnose reductase [Muricauda sp. M10]